MSEQVQLLYHGREAFEPLEYMARRLSRWLEPGVAHDLADAYRAAGCCFRMRRREARALLEAFHHRGLARLEPYPRAQRVTLADRQNVNGNADGRER